MALNLTVPLLPNEPRPVPAHKAVAAGGKPVAGPSVPPASEEGKQARKDFSFRDFPDIINPLQHIPVVSTIYRAITGDEIGGFARVAGGALFGGPVGAVLGGVNAIAAQETGQDIGELALHKVGIGHAPEPVKIAAKEVPKNIPVIEVRPMAHNLRPQMPEIIWDTPSVAAAMSLRQTKALSALPQVSKADEALDKAKIPDRMLQALQKYQEMKSAPPQA